MSMHPCVSLLARTHTIYALRSGTTREKTIIIIIIILAVIVFPR